MASKPASPLPWKIGYCDVEKGTPILDAKNGEKSPVAVCAHPDDAQAIVEAINRNVSTKNPWSRSQVRLFVKQAIKEIGHDGWSLLVPRLRRAVIADKVLSVLSLQERPYNSDQVSNFFWEMLDEAGVEEW